MPAVNVLPDRSRRAGILGLEEAAAGPTFLSSSRGTAEKGFSAEQKWQNLSGTDTIAVSIKT